MADKMECPGCGSYTSGVLFAVKQGEPCPHCGLSSGAIQEITSVRERRGDQALKDQLAEALTELDRLRTWKAAASRKLADIEMTIAGWRDDGT